MISVHNNTPKRTPRYSMVSKPGRAGAKPRAFEEAWFLRKILFVMDGPVHTVRHQKRFVGEPARVRTGRELTTAPGNAASAVSAASCASMLTVARRLIERCSRAHPRPERHLVQQRDVGPFPLDAPRESASRRVSGDSSSGSWHIAIFRPDANPRLRLEIQLLPRSNIERLVPCVEVANRGDAKRSGA